MIKEEVEGKWQQSRDPAKEWWSQLTDDSIDKVSSQRKKYVGLIREKFGLTQEKAEREFDRHMAEYANTRRSQPGVSAY
jgi:uncharacterized protein YjbJ (UPF0337 family)